ncbi:hypothetical protein E2C01_099150 [Portunus trituberculatus]|uniref:Uncharacterized protein n=1 Tax=Portunus trituberculatus TaxID=210409 RepID=A0A5B7KEN3_PORTR|nr:hypothetical protein [Portunus trituberculatus]
MVWWRCGGEGWCCGKAWWRGSKGWCCGEAHDVRGGVARRGGVVVKGGGTAGIGGVVVRDSVEGRRGVAVLDGLHRSQFYGYGHLV